MSSFNSFYVLIPLLCYVIADSIMCDCNHTVPHSAISRQNSFTTISPRKLCTRATPQRRPVHYSAIDWPAWFAYRSLARRIYHCKHSIRSESVRNTCIAKNLSCTPSPRSSLLQPMEVCGRTRKFWPVCQICAYPYTDTNAVGNTPTACSQKNTFGVRTRSHYQ